VRPITSPDAVSTAETDGERIEISAIATPHIRLDIGKWHSIDRCPNPESRACPRKPAFVSPREQWKQFTEIPSGHRFISRYRARRGRQGGLLRKALIVTAGILLMLAGVAMLALPGPGLLTMIIGAAFIAEESHLAARLLDRIDRWVSRIVQRWRARYRDKNRESEGG
jgi:hypothetical protein